MQVLYPRCCALDVHKQTVVACLRLADDDKVTTEVRTFETTTASLIGLRDWLVANKCTHVAMEATGVYWKPVWHILADGDLELVLANAAHVKNLPGRKTGVRDAEWVVDLLAHGLGAKKAIMAVVASIYAQGRKDVSGSRPQSLPTPQQGPAETSSGQTLGRSWLRCGPDPASRL